VKDRNSFVSRKIGSYHLVEEIGKGGFGNVYRAEHLILPNRIVAIKLLHNLLFNSDQERDRFIQEALVLEALQHPYIIHLIDVKVDEDLLYLITDYAAGGSLRERLRRQSPQPLPVAEALSILSQIGQAVQYAHQKHVIHRDLKPENISFDAQGNVLLADFGIATILADTPVKNTEHPLGTPAYMAPEQFKGQNSEKSDQYALGCIAYELVTGSKPFNLPLDANWWAWADKHRTDYPTDPTKLNPHLPAHFKQVIQKAMDKEPDNRYPNISAFITVLSTPSSQIPARITSQTVLPLPKAPANARGSVINPAQKTTEQWLYEGEAHYKARQYEEALKIYDLVIRLNPKFAEAYYRKGNVLKDLGHSWEAIAAYERAIYFDPDFALAYIGKGNVRYDAFKNYAEALEDYQQATRAAPDFALGYYCIGNVLNSLERYEEAISAYESAIRRDSHFLDSYYRKGEVLAHLKRHEEALTIYENAIQVDPKLADAYYHKGELLERLKRYREALSVWNQIIQVAPNSADAYYRKGQALVTIEEQKEQRYKRVSELIKSIPQRLEGVRENQEIGILEALEARLISRPRYKEALIAYNRAIHLRPNHSPYYIAKGDVLKHLGRIREANQAYKKGDHLPIQISADLQKTFYGLALNPVTIPIALGLLLQSWWVLGGSLLGELVLIGLCLWLWSRLSNLNSTALVFFIALPIAIGWGFVGWFLGVSSSLGMSIVLAILGLLIGFFGNVFIFHVFDEWLM